MAILDLSRATRSVDMTDPGLVGFGSVQAASPTAWSFLTPAGHDLQIEGQGMTFDAAGRALSGTVGSVAIDLGNDGFDDPDLVITGLDASAATLDNGPDSFWRVLEGNDVITGGLKANAGTGEFSSSSGTASRQGPATPRGETI